MKRSGEGPSVWVLGDLYTIKGRGRLRLLDISTKYGIEIKAPQES